MYSICRSGGQIVKIRRCKEDSLAERPAKAILVRTMAIIRCECHILPLLVIRMQRHPETKRTAQHVQSPSVHESRVVVDGKQILRCLESNVHFAELGVCHLAFLFRILLEGLNIESTIVQCATHGIPKV